MIAAQPPATPTPSLGARPESRPAASTVLVLAGDPALRCATRLLLRMDDYDVLCAAVLPEALEIAQQARGIDILLVNDLSPDGAMAGQAVARLRAIVGPGLKALIITGHACATLRSLQRDGLLRLVTSPIGADALLAHLQSFRRARADPAVPSPAIARQR